MQKIITCALGLVLVAGCGDAQVTDANKQDGIANTSAVEVPKQANLVPVEIGPFEPPKPWDFLKDGRPGNSYTLTYARDIRFCSQISHELNKPHSIQLSDNEVARVNHPSYLYSGTSGISFKQLGNAYFDSVITIAWTELKSSSATYKIYAVADINNDGAFEYILKRNAYGVTNLLQNQIKYASTNIDKATDDLMAESVKNLHKELVGSKFGKTKPEVFYNYNVEQADATKLPQPYNGLNVNVGQYIKILDVDGRNFLLLGGLTNRAISQGNVLPPIRVLEWTSLEPNPWGQIGNSYQVMCELRQNYYDGASNSNVEEQ